MGAPSLVRPYNHHLGIKGINWVWQRFKSVFGSFERKQNDVNKQFTDNEYSQSPIGRAEYFVELEAAYRNGGVVVPL